MKGYVLIFILLIGNFSILLGQNQHLQQIDSLKREVLSTDNDTIQLVLFGQIANSFSEIFPDSAFKHAQKMHALSQILNLKLEEAGALGEMGYAQLNLGNYPRSLQYFLAAIAVTSDPKNEFPKLSQKFPAVEEFTDRAHPGHIQRLSKLSRIYQYTGILYGNSGNYEKALFYYRNSLDIAKEIDNPKLQCITQITLGRTYHSLGQLDSALMSLQSALELATRSNYKRYRGSILLNTGRVYQSMGNKILAKEFLKQAVRESLEQEYFRGVVAANLALADLFKQSGESDSSFYYINNGLNYMDFLNAPDLYIRSFSALTDYYKRLDNSDSALKYQSFIIKISDSLFNAKQIQQFQNIDFDEVQRQQQLKEAATTYRNKVIKNSLLAGLGVLLLIAGIQFRNNRQKQQANLKIEKAYSDLKSTQAQLVQQEKLASLGQLTAGIAHEIKNPLNFVNNFSEVSIEIIGETLEEMEKREGRDEALIQENLEDIKSNLQKIHEHGSRANSIVTSMLQHSRGGSGEKEPTDLNALIKEYVNLSFHGMRAGKNPIDVEILLDLNPEIKEVDLIKEDFTRVIINLCNNAFDAMRTVTTQHAASLSVHTKKQGDTITIEVADNGPGIPDDIKDKILQPFFTTKKGTEGTGLGLSITHDIVKAHGGELRVESPPTSYNGEVRNGSKFIVSLPNETTL